MDSFAVTKLAVVLVISAALGFIVVRWARGRSARNQSTGMIASLSRTELEIMAGAYFDHQGFRVEHPGGAGTSGDIELVLTKGTIKTLVLCKYPSGLEVDLIATREFRSLMGAREAEHGLIINTGLTAPEVIAYARANSIALVDNGSFEELVTRTVRLAVAPTCPRCGGAMRKRIARKGQHRGQAIWRCASFPKCLGTSES